MASKASGSLTDVILEAHRKKHLAFLMADLGSLTGLDGNRSGEKQVRACLVHCISVTFKVFLHGSCVLLRKFIVDL